MNSRSILISLAIKYHGDWNDTMAAIRRRETLDEKEVASLMQGMTCQAVTILEPDYPESLKNCIRPPLVLFYYGDLSLVKEERKCLAYIGSREASTYGVAMARKLSRAAAGEGFSIVTGLARGIDGEATKACLDEGGKAVAVLGSGIDCPYPASNRLLYERVKTTGLIVSEYPNSSDPRRENFPARNRIIAALCHGIVVGEAGQHSGTLITVSFALGSNKEVGCIPYLATEGSACNALIKDGAFMIETIEDVNSLMGYTPTVPAGEAKEKNSASL